MSNNKKPSTVSLKDYQIPDYNVDSIALRFELEEEFTTVTSHLKMRRNPKSKQVQAPLILDGDQLKLISIKLDNKLLTSKHYTLEEGKLIIKELPDIFNLEIITQIKPQENTALSGLYRSQNVFCTQCEAQGFRRITYFLDRPDVLTSFTTTIVADKTRYPVLLSNGNLIDRGQLNDNKHWVTWHDPFKKPCYLFALVAGDLDCLQDEYMTCSGKKVSLQIYTDKNQTDKCRHAMNCLKKAMRWDEEAYSREYDLDIYMIVAIDAFNMGAMENKGLNIFNAKYILVSPETATDMDYENVLAVVGHEYFHNWTGNRVTCRDWFQLSIKEGMTIFREQEFMAAMTSPLVARINAVKLLRNIQFPEDAGPMAHPVQPDSYIEINNFYTTTIYNKGAEIIHMLKILIGAEKFCKGMDLYFSRYDGHAVTIDDFLKTMEEASQRDLSQFRLWYSQAGTPELTLYSDYDRNKQQLKLTVEQNCVPTPKQAHKKPFLMPFDLGLLNQQGKEIPLKPNLIEISQAKQHFEFNDIPEKPIPSFLRGFTAPVKLHAELSDAELNILLLHDNDAFNRWDACQRFFVKTLLQLVTEYSNKKSFNLNPQLIKVFKAILENVTDKSFSVELITLPTETYLGEQMEMVDIDAIHYAREFIRAAVAERLQPELLANYKQHEDKAGYVTDLQSIGRRRWKNICLQYLLLNTEDSIRQIAVKQFNDAANMTDKLAALSALVEGNYHEGEQALAEFYKQWRQDPLVLDKWFSVQARSPKYGTVEKMKLLAQHPSFDIKNPNRVRSLVGVFCRENLINFHRIDGVGYEFLADKVLELDKLNPQTAARLLEPLVHWKRQNKIRQELMRRQLERILHAPHISKDTYEIAEKSLTNLH